MSINLHVNMSIALSQPSLASAAFGSAVFVAPHAVAGKGRLEGPYSSLTALSDDGFTSIATPAIYGWAQRAFAQNPHLSQVYVGREDVGDADMTATLDAIAAVDPAAFFAVALQSRAAADIEDAAAWLETRAKIGIFQSSDADILSGTPGNIAETLSDLGYHNSSVWYHPTDGEYLDGGIMGRCLGFGLDQPRGSGSWAYQRAVGITPTRLTDPQKTNVLGYNANYYSPVRYTSGVDEAGFSFRGTMASGRSIKVQTTLHWLRARMEEAALNTFLQAASSNRPALLFTDADIGRFETAFMGVFQRGVIGGHLIGGAETPAGLVTPYVRFPAASEISAADKAAGRITGIQAEAVVAPSIDSIGDGATVGFSIDLSF